MQVNPKDRGRNVGRRGYPTKRLRLKIALEELKNEGFWNELFTIIIPLTANSTQNYAAK
ncbi:MAG: hypothetical protein CM15mP47_3070 [Methanobacteriota archaeon]|nr:MAG: hypothetical protein CM15mP47_3070 [Euryarchaeota archaeon]